MRHQRSPREQCSPDTTGLMNTKTHRNCGSMKNSAQLKPNKIPVGRSTPNQEDICRWLGDKNQFSLVEWHWLDQQHCKIGLMSLSSWPAQKEHHLFCVLFYFCLVWYLVCLGLFCLRFLVLVESIREKECQVGMGVEVGVAQEK